MTLQVQPLEKALEQALRCIPVVWPLQQFVATNPLWGGMEDGLLEVSTRLHRWGGIATHLPWSDYVAWFQHGGKEAALRQAIVDGYGDSLGHGDTSAWAAFLSDPHAQQAVADAWMAWDGTSQWLLRSANMRSSGGVALATDIQNDCFTWLAAYMNPTSLQRKLQQSLVEDTATYPLYTHWHSMMMQQGGRSWQVCLTSLPSTPYDAATACLQRLGVGLDVLDAYVFQALWQLKGWVGFALWQREHPQHPRTNRRLDPIELLAMWLVHEVVRTQSSVSALPPLVCSTQSALEDAFDGIWNQWVEASGQRVKRSITWMESLWVWQRAYELDGEDALAKTLSQTVDDTSLETAEAAWVFCIDVRSEGFRRHLEAVGNHATYGAAGFFGFPHALTEPDTGNVRCQAPALLHPELRLEAKRPARTGWSRWFQSWQRVLTATKQSMLGAFALYEIVGLGFAGRLIDGNAARQRRGNPSPSLHVCNPEGWDRVTQAAAFLKSIGLVDVRVPWVVLCGHASTTVNNPYQAALDCGACGGNGGMSNAQLACDVLNDPSVRERLPEQGVNVAASTRFVAACHDTTLDQLEWADAQATGLEGLQHDAQLAGQRLLQERAADQPTHGKATQRAWDWAELVPEWGLVNNAALIIAPRSRTQGRSFSRRVFLHSYDASVDHDGSILTSILLGPMVVAHWINSQYFFSSVNPEAFGSGDKTIHNVLPELGVLEGNLSDLKYGLPKQSVFYQGQRQHEPRRLSVWIEAPYDRVLEVLGTHAHLAGLVRGGWLQIMVLEGDVTHRLKLS